MSLNTTVCACLPLMARAFLLLLLLIATPAMAEIRIEGVTGGIRKAIDAELINPPACDLPRWQTRYRVRDLQESMTRVLETFGYYSSSISMDLQFGGDCYAVVFTIDSGPPTTITRANVAVKGDPGRFQSLFASHPLQPGRRFDHEVYEQFKSSVEAIATRFGYLDGKFAPQRVTVDATENEAEIDLVYETGPRYAFGDVHWENPMLRESLLDRYVTFEPGSPYDTERLGELYQSLIESTYFDNVVVEPMEPSDGRVPIEVRLLQDNPRSIRVGIGVSTDFGPTLVARHSNRLFNERGHQTDLEMSLSAVDTKIGGSYRIPQTNRARGWLSLYAAFRAEDTETSRTQSTTIGARRTVPRGDEWLQTTYIEVNNDQFDVADTSQSSLYVVPGISFTWTRADLDVSRPRRGQRVSLELLGTSQFLASSINFATVRMDGNIIHSLTDKMRILGRTRFGYTETDHFDRLPPRLRFYSGGDARVRGFDFEKIGAVDENGNVIGGNHLAEFSVELDRLVRPKWAVAVFVDAANVSVTSFTERFRRSAGVGLRWYSPVGPVRVDIAKPIDDGDAAFRFHLSLGPDL